MEWALILILGCSLTENSSGWTYHYSNTTLNWTEAREFCQASYTDMVVIQSQEENDYVVNLLPVRESSPYFWIGITKNHKDESWTWIGNNSTWTGNNSWAANEPNNNHATEFCVEIYVNTGSNRGKWNDEKCDSKKSPLCYQAQCNATSCESGRCEETIENTTCICEPGFKGDRCQLDVECPPLSEPENGSHSCSGGNQKFNTTCQFRCNQGFFMNGSPAIICGVTGDWSGPRPTCAAVECPPLSEPENGSHSCSGGNQKFNTTCQFRCNQGFFMNGSPAIICGVTGDWSGPRPTCAAVECPPLSEPDNGSHSCSKGNQIFNTTCQFGCKPGFLMIGSSAVTCEVTGVWSGPRPICTSYKQALLAVAGCGSISTICCFCFCWMEHRKRKKLAQGRQHEEAMCTPSDVEG